MEEKEYIMLRNPHDGEFKVFENTERYAPNAGCPLGAGKTVEEALASASIFGIEAKNVDMGWV